MAGTPYHYNLANNELTAYNSTGTNVGYSYYSNGNLKTQNVTSSGAHWTYAWDIPGNLLQVRKDSVTVGTYAYDGLARRVESVEGASTIIYAYRGTETLNENTGAASTDYVYSAGLRIANVTGPTVSYYHTDALGSTHLVTSSSRAVLFSDSYMPYGQDGPKLICSGTCETYRFTGKPVSQTTGLYYYYQHWYDSSIGRFIK